MGFESWMSRRTATVNSGIAASELARRVMMEGLISPSHRGGRAVGCTNRLGGFEDDLTGAVLFFMTYTRYLRAACQITGGKGTSSRLFLCRESGSHPVDGTISAVVSRSLTGI